MNSDMSTSLLVSNPGSAGSPMSPCQSKLSITSTFPSTDDCFIFIDLIGICSVFVSGISRTGSGVPSFPEKCAKC